MIGQTTSRIKNYYFKSLTPAVHNIIRFVIDVYVDILSILNNNETA